MSIKRVGVLAVWLLFCMYLLSGCVQMAMGVNVNPDGSGTVTVQVGFKEEIFENLSQADGGTDPIETLAEEVRSQGYEVEPYEQDGYKGVRGTKQSEDLSKWFGADAYTRGLNFIKNKSRGVQTFTLTGKAKIIDTIKSSLEQVQASADQADVRLSVTMPYDITQTNAVELSDDKKTATWDMAALTGDINVTASGSILLFGTIPVLWAWIVVGALALVAVVLIAIGLIRVTARR